VRGLFKSPRPLIRKKSALMRSLIALFALAAALAWTSAAPADECPSRPDALGVERTIVLDPGEHPRIGTMQYPESLPLADKEVVLTFDDGPIPHHTGPVLEALAAECVKATFFMVGRQARAYPAWVRRIHEEGHTIATHSQNHPTIFTRLAIGAAQQEIAQGVTSVTAALGAPALVAPFFRFPGLGRSHALEVFLAAQGIMIWSADFPADDWTHISGEEVMRRALDRLERKGKGILLLHDIQPATASMLPHLLRALKDRGYHIVHVVPADADRPKTVTEPEAWVMHKAKPSWPISLANTGLLSLPSAQSFGWPRPFRLQIVAPMPVPPSLVGGRGDLELTPIPAATFSLFGGFGTDSAAVAQLVATDDTFSSMIAPPAIPPRPKLRPPVTKLRQAAAPRPLAGLLPPTPPRFPLRPPSPTRGWP
jgi:peptidoglycan/xylan/chitin deacetylase (PgdA/CDA1 family)